MELRLLGRQYRQYMKFRVENVLSLANILDQTMPGIKTLLSEWNKFTGTDRHISKRGSSTLRKVGFNKFLRIYYARVMEVYQ